MSALRVAVVGCGLIGAKRAAALAPADELVGCHDIDPRAAQRLAARHDAAVCASVPELLALRPDVVVVATVHDRLAELAELALQGGAHVLVEKPAGISSAQIEHLIECQRSHARLVKVGFNHRFHSGIARAAQEVHSGAHGPLMHIRGRYGHGGRPGYEREWRAEPAHSGGGELVDQGMHLLDLTHWLAGPLPLHAALLRTQFWEMPVEDNAALILGEPQVRRAPWALLHVSWTEWKNSFSLEIYCRGAKLQVDGLTRSYGSQHLRIYRMRPELGPPDLEQIDYPDEDRSWQREWANFTAAIDSRDKRLLLGDLHDANYAWRQIERAYAGGPYESTRRGSPGRGGPRRGATRMSAEPDATRAPFVSHVGDEGDVNWSEELEALHEESSRTHFLDVWTRRAMLARIGRLPPTCTVLDVGCSTGYLLEDLRVRLPNARLIGVDLIAAGLRKAHANVPDALLLQADACALPLEDRSVEAVLSANLLEHVPDDERALCEIARVLRPAARAVIVVPVGPRNYDYYDRYLGHERRYARGELASKARRAGLAVLEDVHLGAPLYPPFWLVKQRNRRRYGQLRGAALDRRVAADIKRTNDSAFGGLACRLEEGLLRAGIRLPFGIRGLTVLERAERVA